MSHFLKRRKVEEKNVLGEKLCIIKNIPSIIKRNKNSNHNKSITISNKYNISKSKIKSLKKLNHIMVQFYLIFIFFQPFIKAGKMGQQRKTRCSSIEPKFRP